MAHDARMNLKKWDSVTCRTCHVDPDPPGEDAQAAHLKMETEGATCIDCHQNLVHEDAPETDLNASLAQGKLVLKVYEDDDDEDDDEDEDEEIEVDTDADDSSDSDEDDDDGDEE